MEIINHLQDFTFADLDIGDVFVLCRNDGSICNCGYYLKVSEDVAFNLSANHLKNDLPSDSLIRCLKARLEIY